MKKNRYLFSTLIVAGLFLATGCASKLEVAPTQSIDEEAALATSRDVEVTLIGCYDGLQDIDVYGGAIQYVGDLYGNDNDVRFGGTFLNMLEIADKQLTTGNVTANNTWRDSYVTINRANNVLSAIDKVDEAKRARVEGEAKFIRGSLFFELVRIYAKTWGDGDNAANPGIPLVLTPTRKIGDEDYRPRNSVAEVYAQAIKDLTEAAALLPVSNTIYATKGAANAQLSRIYLQQGNYAAARDAANAVITSGEYSLVPQFGSLFYTYLDNGGANPDEYIFSMTVTTQDGANDMNTYYGVTVGSIPGSAGRGDIRILQSHIDLYEPGDARGAFFVRANNNNYTQKHLDNYGNVPVVRLAEMYLTRAETNFRLGTTTGATPVADVNRIRTRAGISSLVSVTLAQILKERKLELAFEGTQVHDLKRNKAASIGGVAYNSPRLVFPIPQREVDTNKKLVQNPGY